VHAHNPFVIEVDKQLFADCAHVQQGSPGNQEGTVAETALWRGGLDDLAFKQASKQGGNAVDGMALGHQRRLNVEGETSYRPGGFEFCYVVYPAHMALFLGKGRANKGVNEQQRLVNAVLSSPNRADIGVVVLSGEHSGVHAPHQCSPDAGNLVGGHLFAVTRAPKHNPEGFNPSRLIGNHSFRSSDTETGVIIQRVIFHGTVVYHLVAF
jgi:hypothetical protein